MIEHLEKMIQELNNQQDDKEKFVYLTNHRGIFMLQLDNDMTYICVAEKVAESFSESEVDKLNDSINELDDWLGNSGGVISLLQAIDIPCGKV